MRGSFGAPLTAMIAVCLCASCSVARDQAPSGGAHPAGWARAGPDAGAADPSFHGAWLRANVYPLARCQSCHGDDYAGGAVGVSCGQASCHSKRDGPLDCTTCHHGRDAPLTPRPPTGAHEAHALYCDTCHEIPAGPRDVAAHASGDGSTLVRFDGLATHAGHTPTWDSTTGTCANTYCHGAVSPPWVDSPPQIQCNGCHDGPPHDHAPWSRVAGACSSCHPVPSEPLAPVPNETRHLDGVVDLSATCTACHGANDHASPPLSVAGSTDRTTRGVGAHERHLDPSLPDRTTLPIACTACHLVPASASEPGHVEGAPARVRLPLGGAYDSGSASCTVWCHFDKSSGAGAPVWTDVSGAARQCDACHDFPPNKTRGGATHPVVILASIAACEGCHPWGPSTHVNGVVDLGP